MQNQTARRKAHRQQADRYLKQLSYKDRRRQRYYRSRIAADIANILAV